MSFTVGETVVYPNHGAAVIEDIEMRTIKGEDREYLVLRIVAQQDLVVRRWGVEAQPRLRRQVEAE